MGRQAFTKADLDRALAVGIERGLTIKRYRVTAEGIDVECGEPQQSSLPVDLVDWSRGK